MTKLYNEIKNKNKLQRYLDGLVLGDGCISLPKAKGRLPCFKLTIRAASSGWGRKVRKDIIPVTVSSYFTPDT